MSNITASPTVDQNQEELHLDEFKAKNIYICGHGTPVSPVNFYRDIFGEAYDYSRPFVCSSEGEKHIQNARGGMDELLEIASERNDIYVAPVTFYGKVCLNNLKDLYAYVIDLDHIGLKTIKRLFLIDFYNLRPTYVMNSGNGLHLYYLLYVPIAAFHCRHACLKSVLQALKNAFKSDGADMRTSLIHSYRVAGSLTKSNKTTTIYRLGKRWRIDDLEKALGLPQELNIDVKAGSKPNTKQKAKHENILHYPTGHRGFYSNVKSRILSETPIGNRETALFALAVAGYKCGISRELVESDIDALFDAIQKRDGYTMQEKERKKPLTGYSQKYVLSRADTMESWLGFEFERKTKRNGRTQAEHLKIARARRNEKQAAVKSAAVMAYFAAHPAASIKAAAEDLGLNRRTVAKYRQTNPESESVCISIEYGSPPLGDSSVILPPNELSESNDIMIWDEMLCYIEQLIYGAEKTKDYWSNIIDIISCTIIIMESIKYKSQLMLLWALILEQLAADTKLEHAIDVTEIKKRLFDILYNGTGNLDSICDIYVILEEFSESVLL